ncbi:MAG: energy transducer TonB [Burkholderiales bacterium]|nr:energy transducer TonB [Burkholderiales bacterium]
MPLRLTPMQIAIVVSLLLHAGLLVFRLADPQGFDRLMTQMPLDIILVNARSSAAAPDKPQALAQANLQGGGDVAQGRAQSPLPLSERSQSGQADDAATAKLRQLKQQQSALLAQVKQQLSINSTRQSANASEAAAIDQQRRQLLDTLAEIEQRINEQNARPRTRYVSPATREVSYALYHDHMRRLIEEHGTRFFPQIQGRKLYGSLTLMLTVNAQGRVIASQVLKSSGQPELDKLALALAENAGPFGTFSAEMKREFDQLAMVSRYTFKRNLTVQADNPEQ